MRVVTMHPKEVQEFVDKRLVHEIHTSERRSFRGCRRRWHWVFQDFYYPQVTAKPLEFGVAFHNAMEVLYEPKTWRFDREIVLGAAIQKFVETCKAQKQAFAVNYDVTSEVEEDYNERVELGIGMLKYYWHNVAPDYDKNLTPKMVEVEFMVPIQDPDRPNEYLFCKCQRCRKTQQEAFDLEGEGKYLEQWKFGDWHIVCRDGSLLSGKWDGLPVVLAGRIDLLAEDRYGHYWIIDWKTAARLARGDASGQERDEFLELDDQIGSYVMALRRKLGLNVRGFVYVELKKAFPEPPAMNSSRRLGRLFSVNKNQSVDYDTYLRTIKEEDTEAFEAGLYDEFLEFLKNEGVHFHGRYQIVKTDEELEEIERNLWSEALDMVSPDLRLYPSAGRFSCGFCAFRQPCLEKNRQGDYQYMLDTLYDKRDKHYWVKELSTDKQGGE